MNGVFFQTICAGVHTLVQSLPSCLTLPGPRWPLLTSTAIERRKKEKNAKIYCLFMTEHLNKSIVLNYIRRYLAGLQRQDVMLIDGKSKWKFSNRARFVYNSARLEHVAQ